MGPIEQFFWGFVGSLATELPDLSRASRRSRPLPKRFRKMGHWLVRLLVASMAGLLSVAAQVQAPLIALHLGAATPLLIEFWNRKVPTIL